MKEYYFYDVPVYRLNKELYYRDMDKYIEKNMYSGSARQRKVMEDFYKTEPEQRQSTEDRLRQSYGGAWEYNEIIGFIRLYFFGTQIRGEYWSVDSQRVVRTRKKTFKYKTRKLASEIDIYREPDGPTIFSKILEYLDRCKKELRGRYFDITHLKTIGPYVNWKSLYEDSKKV